MCPNTPTNPEQLRADAENRLLTRSAPTSAGWTINADTLSLLYRLSSDPETSSDALKLLHELQTYQVELDLQQAQLIDNENELTSQLAHFQALYEQAPAGYLILEHNGRIMQSNGSAARLFGLDVGHLNNHLLSSLLDAESRPALNAMLDDPASAGPTQAVCVQALDSRQLRLISRRAAHDDLILVLVFPDALAAVS